jgi:hypothetical protein
VECTAGTANEDGVSGFVSATDLAKEKVDGLEEEVCLDCSEENENLEPLN